MRPVFDSQTYVYCLLITLDSCSVPARILLLVAFALVLCVANRSEQQPGSTTEGNLKFYVELLLINVAIICFFETKFDFARWSTFFTAATVLMLFPNLRDLIIAHAGHLWDFLHSQEELLECVDVYLSSTIFLFFSEKICPTIFHRCVCVVVPFIAFKSLSEDSFPQGNHIDAFNIKEFDPKAVGVAAAVFFRCAFLDEANPEMFIFSIAMTIPLSAAIMLVIYKATQYTIASSEVDITINSVESFSEFSVHFQIFFIVCGLTLTKMLRQPEMSGRFEFAACSIVTTIVFNAAGLADLVGAPRLPPVNGILRHVGRIWIGLYSSERMTVLGAIVIASVLLQRLLPQAFVAHYRFQTVDDLEEAIRQYYAIADPRKEAGNELCEDHNLCRQIAIQGFHRQKQLQIELYAQSKERTARELHKGLTRPNFGRGIVNERYNVGTPVGWFSDEEIQEYLEEHQN